MHPLGSSSTEHMLLPKSMYDFFLHKQKLDFFDDESFPEQQQRSMVTRTLHKATTAFIIQVQFQQSPLTELSHILNILECFQQFSSLLLFLPPHNSSFSRLISGMDSLSELMKNFGEEVSQSTIAIRASISLMKAALVNQDSDIRSQQIQDVVTTFEELVDQRSVAVLLCAAYLLQLLDSSTEYLETNIKKIISLQANIDSGSSSIYCDILYQAFQLTSHIELLDAAQKAIVSAKGLAADFPEELYGKIAQYYFEQVLPNSPSERLTKAYQLGQFLLDNQIQIDNKTTDLLMEIQSKYARCLIKQFWVADVKAKPKFEELIPPILQQLELSIACLPPQEADYFAAELQELQCLFQPETIRWAEVTKAYLKSKLHCTSLTKKVKLATNLSRCIANGPRDISSSATTQALRLFHEATNNIDVQLSMEQFQAFTMCTLRYVAQQVDKKDGLRQLTWFLLRVDQLTTNKQIDVKRVEFRSCMTMIYDNLLRLGKINQENQTILNKWTKEAQQYQVQPVESDDSAEDEEEE